MWYTYRMGKKRPVFYGVVVTTLMCAGLALDAAPYEVAGPDAPKPHEQTAVKELSDYLGKRVGGTLCVGGKEGIVFRVGDTELARKQGLLSSQLPPEKWIVRSFGNEVLLNGGGPRGALFAVYHFLEDCCGVRWWSEFEEDVPPAGPLDLPALDLQGQPAFAYRDIYRANQGSQAARFERRVRMNAHGGADLGGAYCFGPPNFCHTFDWYLNADKYMKDHPEWFSLRKGHRVGGQRSGQLCLTNPEVKEEVLKRLLANIEKGTARAKEKGVGPPRIYDMSHNDNQSYCECDRCKAAAEQYGLSGVNLNFVNALAAEVAKRYPDVLLCTWAYQYTQPVPKGGVRAADNVIVRLCDTGSNQASSIAEPDNRAYYDCVMAWSKVTKHLFVWDYAITFSKGLTGLPFPSEFHYGDLFRHYRAYNVSGIFWEHEHPYKADMWELKFFLETKLMENPDLDCNALIERFMREYYGPAGGHVLAYRRYLDKIRREKNAFVSWFPQLSAFKYISDEDATTCNKMLDAAEASVAGDARLLARVRRARLGLDRLMCLRSRSVMFHAPGGVAAEAAARRLAEVDRGVSEGAGLGQEGTRALCGYHHAAARGAPRARSVPRQELLRFSRAVPHGPREERDARGRSGESGGAGDADRRGQEPLLQTAVLRRRVRHEDEEVARRRQFQERRGRRLPVVPSRQGEVLGQLLPLAHARMDHAAPRG